MGYTWTGSIMVSGPCMLLGSHFDMQWRSGDRLCHDKLRLVILCNKLSGETQDFMLVS